MDFELVRASAVDAAVIQNLLQLYTHDFSEHWAGTLKGELGPDGRFPAYPLDAYWQRAGWRAFLIKVHDAPAGFALLTDEARSSQPVAHTFAEFFVVRKHRRQGLGRLAARRLICSGIGQWEVAVARKNLPALAFWRRTIADCHTAENLHELDLRSAAWDGPVIRFGMPDPGPGATPSPARGGPQ